MKKIIGLLLVIILVVIGVYFVYKNTGNDEVLTEEEKQELEDILNATSTVSDSEDLAVELPEAEPYMGQDIEEIGNDPILEKFPKETVEKYVSELFLLREKLIEDNLNVNAWMRVAQLKKVFNNYIGARDAWEYVAYLAPNNATVQFNLAGLYGFYLKDYQKAEEKFELAIILEPRNTNYYINAADFYKNFYTEKKERAEEMLLKGVEEMPNDSSLLAYTADYYKSVGNIEKAISYFEKALELDPGNEGIRGEIEKLKAGL